MKKTISLLVVFSMCLSACYFFVGCTNDNPPDTLQDNDAFDYIDDWMNNDSEPSNTPTTDNSSNSTQWRKFLADYEDWVDTYIVVVKKYSANPSDMSVLTEYTKMLTEMAEWSERIEAVEAELENASTQELMEYSAELSRIALKLAEAAY